MPKYAIVMSADAKYIAGVNGQLNACRYYGMEDDGVEFHLIHSFPDSDGYIEKAHSIFPNFVSTTVDDFMLESGRWKDGKKRSKSLMKWVRWWYPAERLADYDAICVMDADMQITNNFTHYFKMIARSNMLAVPKNDWSGAEWFSYDDRRAMRANPPMCCVPFLITGKRATEFFPLITEYALNPRKYHPEFRSKRVATGDMHPVNLILLQKGLIKDLFPLPSTLWALINVSHVKLVRRLIQGRRYIGIHDRGDLLNSFHRKFWAQRVCQRHMGGHRSPIGNIFGVNTTRVLWEHTKFFNTELDLKIDWIYGDFPSQSLSPLAAKWLRNCIKSSNTAYSVRHEDIISELGDTIEQAGANRAYKLSEQALDKLIEVGVPVVATLNKQW